MIDTSNWKEFRIGDLFDMSLSKDDIQPKSIVEGNIPLISSGKTNNGIVAYIQDDKATLQKAGTITVDMFGKAFYQPNPYYCVSHGRINILTPKFDINEYIGLFVASAIERVSNEKYEFDSMCTGKKLAEDIISLPATSDGQPDWDYMESYMKSIMEESEKSLENLRKANNQKHQIDTSNWKEFRVGDYFTQERGKEKAPKQNKDGDCPLIQETNSNNGFDRLVQPTVIFKGNAITISINYASNVFYQKDDFCASVNIAIIRNDNLNLYNGYFIASVLSSAHRKFDYQNKISKELIDDEIIKLPATPDGSPDWAYMESYMRDRLEEAEKVVAALS